MTQSNNLTATEFWRYSTSVYQQPQAEALCLRLQDSAGVNVNMLLMLCWCLDHQKIVVLRQWQILKAAIAHSDEALLKHRLHRKAAKAPSHPDHSSYARLKEQELALEAGQQSELVGAYNNMKIEESDLTGINASIVAFIHAYQLRNNEAAIDDIRALLKLSLSD
ncbi:TIGR02444 family protein [Alteromonas lipotrueiana]|uniref:TIGR02444 family protein n=1 Tax=Alteromonas lipotrueiana TaxID=2803815 RepID=UPI001C490BC1|nr:TIGR02444 family protein [Alteromonas lipotrueiana]|tara:strand:- start:454 stop:948 length:495 start_codon:yes stop_codon:yes gene_type:complete